MTPFLRTGLISVTFSVQVFNSTAIVTETSILRAFHSRWTKLGPAGYPCNACTQLFPSYEQTRGHRHLWLHISLHAAVFIFKGYEVQHDSVAIYNPSVRFSSRRATETEILQPNGTAHARCNV